MSKKQIKIIAVLLLIGFLIWLIGFCVPPPKEKKKKTHQNQNITLFIDLSNHLDETQDSGKGGIMGKDRWENFIDFTELFGDVYTEKILTSTKKLNQYNEEIHIRTHPTTDFPQVDGYLVDIKLDKRSIQSPYNVKEDRAVITSNLIKNVKGIMEDSRRKYKNASTDLWPGSNIYDYFKRKSFYNPEDQNLLIIYTDGYPYHKDNNRKQGQYFLKSTHWKTRLHNMDELELKNKFQSNPSLGMKAATTDLKHLRVLIIGGKDATNGDNLYEKELVKFLWSDWLQKMGVKQKNIQMLFMDDCDTPSLKSAYKWLLNTPWDM